MRQGKSDGEILGGGAALGLVLLLVALLITAYLLVQAGRVTQGAFASTPKTVWLWVAAGAAVGSACLVLVTRGNVLALVALAVSLLTLVAVARIVQLRADTLLQRPVSVNTVVDNVLHNPW